MTLGDYLAAAAGKVRVANVHDCCTFIADWAMVLGDPDPMARWRGAYVTEGGALELIAAAGGLANLVGPAFEEIGWRRADAPQMGDVGVVALAGHEGAGIFSGRRWMLVADRGVAGVTFTPDHVVACWTRGTA